MSAKKKKQANSPLRIVIILILLGLLAYKYQLFDGKLLENIPTIENNEEKPEIRIPTQHGGALEIPTMQSGTGGQILKRKGYTLSYNADYKTPQWVAWELTKKRAKSKRNKQIERFKNNINSIYYNFVIFNIFCGHICKR